MPFDGYMVVYAVETCPPQDRFSRAGSSYVFYALWLWDDAKCSALNGMILSASRQGRPGAPTAWTQTIGKFRSGHWAFLSYYSCQASAGTERSNSSPARAEAISCLLN